MLEYANLRKNVIIIAHAEYKHMRESERERQSEREIENTLKIPFLIVDRPSGNFCMSNKSILNFLDKNPHAGFACLMVARQQQVKSAHWLCVNLVFIKLTKCAHSHDSYRSRSALTGITKYCHPLMARLTKVFFFYKLSQTHEYITYNLF